MVIIFVILAGDSLSSAFFAYITDPVSISINIADFAFGANSDVFSAASAGEITINPKRNSSNAETYRFTVMGRELLKHKEILKFTSLYEAYLRENTDKKFWLVNTNRLVKFYPGVDGLKTGFTHEAKYCLTATAQKNNMRVIAVVFGAENPKERNAQITHMLDYAFAKYQSTKMYKLNQPLALLPIEKGQKKKVSLVTSEPISLLTKKGYQKVDIRPKVIVKKDVQAPIKKGQKLGKLQIIKGNKVIQESDLVASESIKRASWFDLYKRSFGMFTHAGRE